MLIEILRYNKVKKDYHHLMVRAMPIYYVITLE